MPRRIITVTFLLFVLPFALAAGNGKIETIGEFMAGGASDALRQALEPKGYRVLLDDGSTACELWLRAAVPAGKNQGEGALYPQLAESTLVGVLAFPKAGTDYRGQPIPAAAYTLRYALVPNDGNHLGVSPNPDFLLLVPVAADPDPDVRFKFQELVALSRKATGSGHPAPLNMAPASGNTFAVSKNDQDQWVLTGTLKMQSGETLSFGLIVKGTAAQ